MGALALSLLSLTIVKRDVSSAKSFTLDFNSLGKSLMSMRKRSGPNIEPWETPFSTFLGRTYFYPKKWFYFVHVTGAVFTY